MAAFKCKMCGGMLEVEEGKSIVTCDYCGSEQTVGTRRDETVVNMYNRATNIRMKNDFDKAQEIYEKILDEDDTDAEAHWGVVLCKYGIEYVEDPKTHNRIPTCHRTLVESVTTDVDYLAAIQYGDVFQRQKYEEEAKKIAELQNEILSISSNEKPFDVFICYKEKDENGGRTQDSVLANDIYYQLTQAGLRVFYAAVTLEDKLGTEYEPYIYAALHSAKVMLVIGTKPEYFGAVWVKNEWSRYLAIMKNDRSRTLIPCFRDMDAYDLPEEFAHLQAQDMSKIGFINDIVRGIRKLTAPAQSEKPVSAQATDTKSGASEGAVGANTTSLLKRVSIFLEDRDWKSANEYCEKVLDIDPECAEAYLGKLMADMKASKMEDLSGTAIIDQKNNFKKILRYGDERLVKEITHISEQNQRRLQIRKLIYVLDTVAKRTEKEYASAILEMSRMVSSSECEDVYDAFKMLGDYKDSEKLAKECIERCHEIEKQERQLELQSEKNAVRATRNPICAFDDLTYVLKTDGRIEVIGAGVKYYKSNYDKEQCIIGENVVAFCPNSQRNIYEFGVFWLDYNCRLLDSTGSLLENSFGRDERRIRALKAWSDIVQIAKTNDLYSVDIGVKSDGTVVSYPENSYLSKWSNIASITCYHGNIIGLKKDGTAVACCSGTSYYDVSKMSNLVSIVCGSRDVFGLKADGTVVSAKDRNAWEDREWLNIVLAWKNIIAISAGNGYVVGLKSDGTVVTAGDNDYGQCDVSGWRNIVAISAGYGHTVGLKSDGTLVAVGKNDYGQCDVGQLKDIMPISGALSFKEDTEFKKEIIQKTKQKREENKRAQEEARYREWRRMKGVCQYCGGTFKGLFSKKCSSCGKPKDY